MATTSDIEWTDTTWNPLAGCTRASAGCDNCYAATMALRLDYMAQADIAAGREPGGKRKYMGVATKTPSGRVAFNGRINLDEAALDEPYSWRKPRRVFVNSMSDLFHKDVPDDFITDVWRVMERTPQHTYQVLTKRPERMAEWVGRRYTNNPHLGPAPNIWCGTSVEDQRAADSRIPALLKVPSAVRFLSCEPLLGPVDLGSKLRPYTLQEFEQRFSGTAHQVQTHWINYLASGIHWVIVGGESGRGARPMAPAWAESLRDQCAAAGVAFYMKQMGSVVAGKGKGGDAIPERLMVRQFPV